MIEIIKEYWWATLLFVNYIVAISAAFTIILKNLNPSKTISYIMVLVFFPFLGLVVYYLFGQEYRKTKIFSRKNILKQSMVQEIRAAFELDKKQMRALKEDILDDRIKLVKLLKNNEKEPLTLMNDVEILRNGEVKFKRLLEDLKTAENHIHLEYYIIMESEIATQIMDILCAKALSGVQVRLSYDDVGSKIAKASIQRLKAAGVEVFGFMPVLFQGFTGKMNYRNHRKIAVVDGLIAYVGGINISDKYINKPDTLLFWRDTHLRIVGDAVSSIQIHFLTNWDFVSNTRIKVTKALFPEVTCETPTAIQIAASGPDTDWANIMESIFIAITTADYYVYITTPYFIPNDEIITALQVASRAGVDVRLIIPKESDSWTAKYATNSFLNDLLAANVKVYRYAKGFVHAKTIVVDDKFCSVGTSNMDYRSFNINFEINALIYNEDKAKELKTHFVEDMSDSELLVAADWQARSKIEKIKESYSRLWAPLL